MFSFFDQLTSKDEVETFNYPFGKIIKIKIKMNKGIVLGTNYGA